MNDHFIWMNKIGIFLPGLLAVQVLSIPPIILSLFMQIPHDDFFCIFHLLDKHECQTCASYLSQIVTGY